MGVIGVIGLRKLDLTLCNFFSARSLALCSFALRLIELILEIEDRAPNTSPLLVREALRSVKTTLQPLLLCATLLSFIRIEYPEVLISRD